MVVKKDFFKLGHVFTQNEHISCNDFPNTLFRFKVFIKGSIASAEMRPAAGPQMVVKMAYSHFYAASKKGLRSAAQGFEVA